MKTRMIIYFLRLFIINLFVYFIFTKISNTKNISYKSNILIVTVNLFLTVICIYLNYKINFFVSMIGLIIIYSIMLGLIIKVKVGYALVVSITSYAICMICYVIGTILTYILYSLFHIENLYINLLMILTIQFALLYSFFKIKRFRNGFDFLYKKLNNDFTDIIITNISIALIFSTCLLGTIFDGIEQVRRNLLITFIILCFMMIIIIQKMLIMHYKQKQLIRTLQEYEENLKDKDIEIEKLKNEKYNISEITHKFYNRQKALELLVKQNIGNKNKSIKEKTSQNILNIIKSLTEEYSEEFTIIKNLNELEKTGISEIDNMFKYMQSECSKNNIEFKLKIIGNIYPLINNIIPKNKLETLIGDHIRDAINAVNYSKTENKEILVILGIKDKNYELTIYDTGIEFEIETLIKLGTEPITTHADNGGSGIGFMTTFETMKQTKASLIITEQLPSKENYYTKSVTIRFDGKNQYRICSYRAEKIKEYSNTQRILIEKI